MRTYTIREVRGSGAGHPVVVDIVLHLGERRARARRRLGRPRPSPATGW